MTASQMMIAPSLRRFLKVPRQEPVACKAASTSRMTAVGLGFGQSAEHADRLAQHFVAVIAPNPLAAGFICTITPCSSVTTTPSAMFSRIAACVWSASRVCLRSVMSSAMPAMR